MADNLTRLQRSYCMSRVKSKDTRPEVILRSALHRRGYRFRKHANSLPGKPDIVFTRSRIAVFVDGDFWHGYRFSQWAHTLQPYWKQKILQTRLRDRRNFSRLRRSGWKVIRIWQHDIECHLDIAVSRIEIAIQQAMIDGRHNSTQRSSRVPPKISATL